MRAMRLLGSWGLALFLVFMFLQATIHPLELTRDAEGSVKLFDPPGQNIVFATIAEKTQIQLVEPTGRVIVAIAELLAALLLLLPMTRRTGAGLSFLILAGAVAAHSMPNVLGREIPATLGSTTETDGGQLFALAIAMLAASMLLYVIHPRKR